MRKDRVPPASAAWSGSVRPACADDADAVSHLMAGAFQDDPSFAWCIPNSAARKQHLPAFFSIVFDALLELGHCYCTSDVAAAAMWVPPAQDPLTEKQTARLREVFESIGPDEAARFMALIELMDSCHPRRQHLYLWFLGVSTGVQNRGLGSTLLRSGLHWCDERGLPAYLEATTDRNRRLYERHGFQVTDELIAIGSLPMWPMWREPRNR